MTDEHPNPSPDNMREAERLAELIFEWKDSRPSRDQIEIIADALQAKDEKFDAVITAHEDALLDAEAEFHAARTASVNAMREALEFYANARNYDLSVGQHGVVCSLIEIDNGEKASEALSSAPAVETVGAMAVSGKEVIERLDKCRKMIGKMCSEGRPPLMQIPAEHNERNEDIYICDTLDMAKEALTSPAVEPVESRTKISQTIEMHIKAGESFTAIQCPNCAQVLDIQRVPPAVEQESAKLFKVGAGCPYIESIPSDTNAARMKELLKLANPTHVVSESIKNEIPSTEEQESAWRDVLQKEAAYHCTYCADGREAEKHKGGWWHRVARGGDLGQLEPCKAHVVHSIRQRLIDTPPKPRIENP